MYREGLIIKMINDSNNNYIVNAAKLKQGLLAIFALVKKPNYDQILKLIDKLSQPVEFKTEAIDELLHNVYEQDKWYENLQNAIGDKVRYRINLIEKSQIELEKIRKIVI